MKAKIDVGMIDVFGSDYHVARIARLSRGVPWEVDAAAKMDSEKWSKSTWEENTKTLRFLFEQKHMTPFEFAGATFYIEAPIFVARQLMRYRCASYLERSLRYCKPFEENEEYNKLLADGFKRERARAVLPLITTTAFYMHANLREWFHIFDERLSAHAQEETRLLVSMIHNQLASHLPLSVALWDNSPNGQAFHNEFSK